MPIGYLAGLVVLVVARPTVRSLALALPLALAGEGLRIWSSGHLRKTQALATGGPYAHTRNPLYLGSLLIALGVGVACRSVWAVLVVAAYFLAFYPAVVREEARFLAEKFEEDYRRWSAEVPLFAPRVRAAGPRASRFDWALVRANREWRTAMALPLLAVLLYLRPRLPF